MTKSTSNGVRERPRQSGGTDHEAIYHNMNDRFSRIAHAAEFLSLHVHCRIASQISSFKIDQLFHILPIEGT